MMKLSIVIPAYNESQRLPKTIRHLESCVLDPLEVVEVIIADDGSVDGTCEVANSLGHPLLKVVRTETNHGKGHAIRMGIKNVSPCDLILIADADMATPWIQALNLLEKLNETSAEVALASRDLPESDVQTSQSWIRENLGKSFNVLVRSITGLPFRDTQCGFKMLRYEAALALRDRLTVNDFAWDVELLMLGQRLGYKMVEVPVEWHHVEESRVHIVRDGLKMLYTVSKLSFKLRLRGF